MRTIATVTRTRWAALIGTALILGFVILGLYMLDRLSTAATELGALRAQQASQSQVISALSSGLATAEQQLTQHGIKPVPPPPATILQGQAGPTGPAGPAGPGPSDAQVAEAVAGYLKANPPQPGPAGPAGAPAGDAQIAAAVARYLAANPPPPGPPGSPGPTGTPGPAGAAGPAGPAGPAGAAGPPGAPGPACPSGYTPQPETINDHQAQVCETPTPSPTPPGPSSSATPTPTAPAAYVLPLTVWPALPPRRP